MGSILIGIGIPMVVIVVAIGLGALISWTLDKDWAGKFWAAAITITGIVGILLIGVGFGLCAGS